MANCAKCGQETKAGEAFCRQCGTRLSGGQAGAQTPFPKTQTNESELAMFVGKNADKYLERFKKFTSGTTDSFSVTWHWPAFFFSFFWMLYRKMYLWAFLGLFLGCVPYVGLLAMFGFGMAGYYLYYKHSKAKLLELKAQPMSDIERGAAIARAGGTNGLVVILAPFIGVALLGIIAAIAVPQFMVYKQRAFDRAAKQQIEDACTRGTALFDKQPARMLIEPDDLLYAGLERNPEVEMMLLDGRRETFSMSAHHKQGKNMYITDRQCRIAEEPVPDPRTAL